MGRWPSTPRRVRGGQARSIRVRERYFMRTSRRRTVTEIARMGGLARAKTHSRAQLRALGKAGRAPGETGPEGTRNAQTVSGDRQDSGRMRCRTGRLGPHHGASRGPNEGVTNLY